MTDAAGMLGRTRQVDPAALDGQQYFASLLGQGLPPVHAAAAAAWLHGTAADRCAARMGEYGLLPSDVAAELPYLLP